MTEATFDPSLSESKIHVLKMRFLEDEQEFGGGSGRRLDERAVHGGSAVWGLGTETCDSVLAQPFTWLCDLEQDVL